MQYERAMRSPAPARVSRPTACPSCGSKEYLYNEVGVRNAHCGLCGKALDWSRGGQADAK